MNLFGLDEKNHDHKKAKRALKYAWDIRKFEIDLYWKRSTHFWTFIGVIFAGYFALLGSDKIENKDFYALIINCIGLVFSFAWYLANRGSKYWQENWEYQIEMLEDDFIGPLYKTTLSKKKGKHQGFIKNLDNIFLTSKDFSVTRINQIISLFTTVIWGVLILHNCVNLHTQPKTKTYLTILSIYNFDKSNITESYLDIVINNQDTHQSILFWSCTFIVITIIFLYLLFKARTTIAKKEEINRPEKPRDVNSNIIIAEKRNTRISPQERLDKL